MTAYVSLCTTLLLRCSRWKTSIFDAVSNPVVCLCAGVPEPGAHTEGDVPSIIDCGYYRPHLCWVLLETTWDKQAAASKKDPQDQLVVFEDIRIVDLTSGSHPNTCLVMH